MSAQDVGQHLRLILFLSVIISGVLGNDPDYKFEITVGVIVPEDNLDGRMSIQKALVSALVPETAVVKIKEIIIRETEKSERIESENASFSFLSQASMSDNFLCGRLLERGPSPTLVIDATDKKTDSGSKVKEFLRRWGLPTVSISTGMTGEERSWNDLREEEKNWLIQVNSPTDILSSIASDVMIEYGPKHVALLYDSSFSSVSDKLFLMTQNSRFNSPALFIDPKKNMSEILLSTREFNVSNYIVLAGMANINKLLESAASLNLHNDNIGYYLITKSRGQLKCPSCKSASVLMIQPTPSPSFEYNHTSTLENVNTENKLEKYFYYDLTRFILHTVYEMMSSGIWPQLTFPVCEGKDGRRMSTEQLNQRTELALGSELSVDGFYGKFGRMVFDDFKSGISYQDIVMKVTKIDFLRGQTYDTKQGDWSFGPNQGSFVYGSYQSSGSTNTIGVPSATTFGQDRMRVVIYLQEPFIMKRIINNATHSNHVEYYGYCIDLLELIREKMANASQNSGKTWEWTYELYEVPDGRFGEKRNDGSWTGIIGELAEKKADIGLGPVAVMAERETVVEFTVPYYDLVGINILMKKAAVPSHLFKFLTVLENDVWYTILASYIFASFVIWAFDRISPYSYYNNKEGWADQRRRDFSLKETMWFCMTSLTPQGGGEGPQNLSGRLATLTWWTFGFCAIACYTANLAAFLTVSRLDSTMESLEHLSHQFRIRYATQEKTEALVYFERMSYIEHKFYQIWKNMSLNEAATLESRSQFTVWDYPISDKYTKILAQMYQAKMPKSYYEGVRRVRQSKSAQEGFAFIADAVQVKFAIKTHCDLYSIGNEFSRKPIALVVQQNTTLKDALSSAILKLLNERRLEKLKEEWWKKYATTCEDTKKSSDGISIHNIGGVFIVIFAGVILACITLVYEWVMLRIKKKNYRQIPSAKRDYPGYQSKRAPGTIGRTY